MSPKEVAGAVTDLLKAAGMPLDLERRQLLQQSLALQQQAKEAQEELAGQAQVRLLTSTGDNCACSSKSKPFGWGQISSCSSTMLQQCRQVAEVIPSLHITLQQASRAQESPLAGGVFDILETWNKIDSHFLNCRQWSSCRGRASH